MHLYACIEMLLDKNGDILVSEGEKHTLRCKLLQRGYQQIGTSISRPQIV